MAEVVLFHSVLGLRDGVHDAAARLRAAGHTVHTPDLYRGHPPFDAYEPAMAHQDEVGQRELLARAEAAVADLPPGLVYAGFSAGGASAEHLAGHRPGARGLLLLAAGNDLRWFQLERWPATVPVEVHYGTGDPYREEDELEALRRAVEASGAPFQLFEYELGGHLFSDPGLPAEYDAAATELMFERIAAFLDRTDRTDQAG